MPEIPRASSEVEPLLSAVGIEAGYRDRLVLRGVDLDILPGTVTAIIGPNGCGKSTLLKVLARLLEPSAGRVLVGGQLANGIPRREFAKRVAILPQNPIAPEGVTVVDLVARGREPHRTWYQQWTAGGEEVVLEAMNRTGTATLATRMLDELSGGQRQRAWIAMTIAQESGVVLLDEPTSHLDPAHVVDVLEMVRDLAASTGRAFVLVLHDLGAATRYADRLVVLSDGNIVASGTAAEAISAPLLADVFGLDARVFADPEDGVPTIAPRLRPRRAGLV